MTLITADELARAGILVVFGGGAGMGALLAPGSLLWAAPAFLGAVAMGFTVPEVRHEVRESLPALREAVRKLPRPAALLPQRDRPTVTAAATAASAPPPPSAGGSAPVPAGALRPRQWLQALNDRPDDNPHLTVVGPSGTGKTTFVAATLGQRGGRVVVLTPKVTPGAWRGAEVVTLDDDLSYAPLAAALNDLQTEAKQRSAKLRRGEPLEPMTVVLDELPELHAEIPGAGKFAVRLSRWGRELGMRQVVIATSDDALNIPGWAATRSNYARVTLGKPTADGTRPATLDDGQTRRSLDLGRVKAGAERAHLRPWRGKETIPPADDALLATFLAHAIPPHQDGGECPVPTIPGNGRHAENGNSSVTVDGGAGAPVTVNVTQVAPTTSSGRRAERTRYTKALEELYRAAGAEGRAFSPLYAQLKGSKEIVFAAWQEGKKGSDHATV